MPLIFLKGYMSLLERKKGFGDVPQQAFFRFFAQAKGLKK